MMKILAAVLASATLGGGIGALATAATTSQASPAAVAAAVSKVQDQRAEKLLGLIAVDTIGVEGELKTLHEDLDHARSDLFVICYNTARITAQTTGCER
jgi:hypothetical protein